MGLIQKIFGTYSQRELKSIYPIADQIEALEEEYRALTDEQLQAKTPEFKQRLQQGETLDDILPEAFAAVREAADRVLGLRPYRVQLIGGIVLHQGRIAEMKTGEGKTLTATMPAYLNALSGEGVDTARLIDELMDLKRADTLGKAPSCFYYVETIEEMRALAHELLKAGEPYTLRMLAINGGDLIRAGVKPGPELGQLLNSALDAVIEDNIPNEREALLVHLKLN